MNDMLNLCFRKENIGDINNLILDIDEEMCIDSFSLNMIGRNQIQYLLPMQLNQYNTRLYFRYDITGMTTLRERVTGILKKEEVMEILNGMINAFEEIEAYMLSCENMYLNADYIFMDRNRNYRFLFVPVEEGLGVNVMSFLHRLVNQIQPDYSEKDTYFFRILNAFNGGAIEKLSDLKELLRKNPDAVLDMGEVTKETQVRKDIDVESELNKNIVETEKQSKENGMLNLGIKTNFAIPGVTQEKKAETKLQEESNKAIPVMSMPKVAQIAFEIPGSNGNGMPMNIPAPLVAETKKEEKPEDKKVKKENKKPFSFFEKKSKTKKEETLPNIVPQSTAIPETPKNIPDMYESYDKTVVLQVAHPETADSDVTVLLDERPKRAELIRQMSEEHFEVYDTAVLGAGTMANCKIDNNRKISRKHASIQLERGSYYIRDNNSSNGTFLNGRRLIPEKAEELRDNDMIRLADEDFIFRIW